MVRNFALSLIIAFAAVVGCAAATGAGFKIGDPAPDFKNLPGADSKTYSLGDFKQDLLVLCITCNHCPVAAAYEERINDFTKKYAAGKDPKLGFVALSVSNDDEDKLDKMAARSKSSGFQFPYLHDQTQKIGRQLSAHVTPEFYLFDKNRKLVYWGSMDDDMAIAKVSKRYLEEAVEAALAGKKVPEVQTKAFGCPVIFDK